MSAYFHSIHFQGKNNARFTDNVLDKHNLRFLRLAKIKVKSYNFEEVVDIW